MKYIILFFMVVASWGKVNATRIGQASKDKLLFIQCQGENIVSHTSEKMRSRRLNFVLGFKDNRLFYCRVIPYGSLVDVSERDKTLYFKGNIEDGKVNADIEFLQDMSDLKEQNKYRLSINGLLTGDKFIAQTSSITKNGKPVHETGSLSGNVELNPVLNIDNSVLALSLQDALPDKFLNVFIVVKNGNPLYGFATTPNFNNATHDIVVDDLRLKSKKIHGQLKVKIIPDSWTPEDGKPIDCCYDLDIKVQNSTCVGNFAGYFGTRKVQGTTEGELQRLVTYSTEDIDKLTIKLEDALTGGEAWENRVFLRFNDLRQGKKNGTVTNNHTSLSGNAILEEMELKNGKFRATCMAFAENGNVSSGNYHFNLEGFAVNQTVVGNFTTTFNNQKIKNGFFWLTF